MLRIDVYYLVFNAVFIIMTRPYVNFILIGCTCMTYILSALLELLRKLNIVVATLRAYLRNIVFGAFLVLYYFQPNTLVL